MEFLIFQFEEILCIYFNNQILKMEFLNQILTCHTQTRFQFQHGKSFTGFRFLSNNRKSFRNIIQCLGCKLISSSGFQEQFNVCCRFITLQFVINIINILSGADECISIRHTNRSIRSNILFFPFFGSNRYRIILNCRFIRIIKFE